MLLLVTTIQSSVPDLLHRYPSSQNKYLLLTLEQAEQLFEVSFYIYLHNIYALHHIAQQNIAQFYTIKQHGITLHNFNLCFGIKVKNILKISLENPLYDLTQSC